MATTDSPKAQFDLSSSTIVSNPSIDQLIRDAVGFDDAIQIGNGAVRVGSGKYTGRVPQYKYIVRTPDLDEKIWWDNNHPISSEQFRQLRQIAQEHLTGRPLYVIDTFAGADPEHRISVRFVLERPYHALFIKQLLIRPTANELRDFVPDWTIVDVGKHPLEAASLGLDGDAAVALDFGRQEGVIVGTEYAGEIKKSVFTIMNLLLPSAGVLSMHCSANVGPKGDTALFFGLSGTGKTTLSADPSRLLVGDDEHGWSDTGVFNIEGGCYAKCLHLDRQREPEIWDAIRDGAVLENVVLRADGTPDYDDDSVTENTRAAYPIEYIDRRFLPPVAGHPENIVFLTCDALGVLPPISRLTPEQAYDLFLIGYTAKLAGTEVGVTVPKPVFSTCFGAPFLPLHPSDYANLLAEKILRHGPKVWLLNTGWTGGPVGTGERIKLSLTRAMLAAAIDGLLESVEFVTDPVFGFQVPTECPNVPNMLLLPKQTWKDPQHYDEEAIKLRDMFHSQLAKVRAA
jgi:phosphoenolpyruvate carboxykinase (ATP)